MKVIFLDKDGVLNSDEYIDKVQGQDIDGVQSDVDIEKVKLLKEAVDITGAKVVLTASSRYTTNAQKLIQLLREYQMLLGLTPLINNKRGLEIKQWLLEHPNTEDFVILDDEVFSSYDEELMKKLIKISNGNGINYGEGLQRKDVEQIIQRLGEKRKIEQQEYDDER